MQVSRHVAKTYCPGTAKNTRLQIAMLQGFNCCSIVDLWGVGLHRQPLQNSNLHASTTYTRLPHPGKKPLPVSDQSEPVY